MPPARVALTFLFFVLAIGAFQFIDDSIWYPIGGGVSLTVSLALGWRYRTALRSFFRHRHNDDPRKLYNSRNA